MSEDQAVSAPAVDVAAIRAALEAATPGPWAMGAYGPGQEHVAYTSPRAAEEGIEEHTVSAYVPFVKDEECQPNSELIVLLRNNAEALLDALDDGYCAGYDHGVEDQMDRQEAALAEAERRGAAKALRAAAGGNMRWVDDPVEWVTNRADAIERGEVSP